MKTECFEFIGHNNTPLAAALWLPEGDVTHILQINHGTAEHTGRFWRLAEYLTAHGIAVAGFDLRGHGRNPHPKDLAVLKEGEWAATIQDMRLFFRYLDDRFLGCPHYMFGYSLGSFLIREYLEQYSDGVAGVAFTGTGYQPGWVLGMTNAIVGSQIKKVGFDGYSPLVYQLSFDAYNQKFKPNRTPVDWVCADEAELDDLLADSLCSSKFSAGLFYQMVAAMKLTNRAQAYENWNKDMPVLILAGQFDPVGNMGKGVVTLKKRMEQAGMKNVSLHILPNSRHNTLMEHASGDAEKAMALMRDLILS